MFDPSIESDLRNLPVLGRTEICDHWESLIGQRPPAGMPLRLLVHAVAYEIQAKCYGGIKPAVRKQLHELVDQKSRKSSRKVPPLRPGHRLVREWNGKTYVVDVVEEGFEWQGVRYGSLTQIAGRITGTHRSGPRFFGLVTRSVS